MWKGFIHAILLILLLFNKQWTHAHIPRIDLLGRAERSQPDLRRKDTEGLWEGRGCQAWLSPEVGCSGVPRATTATLGQKRATPSCSPPGCCSYPPSYCCLCTLQTKTAYHLNFLFSSLFCIKFVGLWLLAHERFIPFSFFSLWEPEVSFYIITIERGETASWHHLCSDTQLRALPMVRCRRAADSPCSAAQR